MGWTVGRNFPPEPNIARTAKKTGAVEVTTHSRVWLTRAVYDTKRNKEEQRGLAPTNG